MFDVIEVSEMTTVQAGVILSVSGAPLDAREDYASEHLIYNKSSKYVQTIVTASLADFFVTHLPCEDDRLKAVFWQFEGAVLRIWTIIASDDFEFEKLIYRAEKNFLRKFPKVHSDFYVVFQQGRRLNEVAPTEANQAYPRL